MRSQFEPRCNALRRPEPRWHTVIWLILRPDWRPFPVSLCAEQKADREGFAAEKKPQLMSALVVRDSQCTPVHTPVILSKILD